MSLPFWVKCLLAGVLHSERISAKRSWRNWSGTTAWTHIKSCRSRKNTASFVGIHREAQNGSIERSFPNTRKCPGGSAFNVVSLQRLLLKAGLLPGAKPVLNRSLAQNTLMINKAPQFLTKLWSSSHYLVLNFILVNKHSKYTYNICSKCESLYLKSTIFANV